MKANLKKTSKTGESAVVADAGDDDSFAFVCTTNHSMVANLANVPKEMLGACIDSGASCHYCPDRSKFINYRPMLGRDIVTADGRALRVLGIGDVRIELPNGDKRTKSILKDVVHAPDMAFTLISVRRLDHAKCSVKF